MGWIKLDRQLQEHWLWKDDEFSKGQAWIDLLMLANYEDKKTSYKGEIIVCKRGDVNISIAGLAERWRWSRKKVRAFLNLLESDGMVTTKVTTHRTTITLENYRVFQDQGTTEVTTNAQQRNSKGNNQCTQLINKEDKEIKEIKNDSFNEPTKNNYICSWSSGGRGDKPITNLHIRENCNEYITSDGKAYPTQEIADAHELFIARMKQ